MNEVITSVLFDWYGDSMYSENKYQAKLASVLILRALKKYHSKQIELIEKDYPKLEEKDVLL
jgi:hypothetical protein